MNETTQKLLTPQLGIMPATSAYTMSAFEKYARKVAEERRPMGTRTKAKAEKGKMKRGFEQALRRGEPDAELDLDVARAAGKIDEKKKQEYLDLLLDLL
jgi:hypothetical protein